MTLAAILFDFDGLILDTETSEFETVSESFADHGLTLSRQEWVSIIGTADHPHWTEMLETALGHPLTDLDTILETRRARHHARIAKETLKPGVISMATEAAAAGVGVAICSSSPLDWIEGHLTRLGVREHFGPISCRDDVGAARTKPHPDVYLLGAERLGVSPTKCVVFEDSRPGITAANAAGCVSIAVPGGMTADEDFTHADRVVGSIAELSLADLDAMIAAAR